MKNYTKICNEQLKEINGGGKAGKAIAIFDAFLDGWNGFYNAADGIEHRHSRNDKYHHYRHCDYKFYQREGLLFQ